MRQRTLLILLVAALMTACASQRAVSYQPEASDKTLADWEAAYPLEYEDWADSVHGQAYLAGDENAPGCTDCHDDPDTGEIQTAAFRLDIPNRCGRCHADAEMMAGYDISPDVVQTYLADYHGETIAYYHATAPDQYRYEAVCSDCHSSHAIYGPDDRASTVAPANLQHTCQTCHHDAPANFATAFGHYRPARTPVSTAETPLLFWVKLFYQALIPVILGSMLVFVALDFRHRRQKGADHG